MIAAVLTEVDRPVECILGLVPVELVRGGREEQ
jgi:hypothetical protein